MSVVCDWGWYSYEMFWWSSSYFSVLVRFSHEMSCLIHFPMSFHAFWPYEISCFSLHSFHMRLTFWWDLMFCCRCKISLGDVMLFSCIVILWISYFLSVTRSPYEISCFLALMRFYEISKWDLMLLWPLWDFLMGFHQHALHQVDTYVWGWRNVTWTCSCDWRRFSRGLGLWSDVCYLKNVCLLWAVTVFWSRVLPPSFLARLFWM